MFIAMNRFRITLGRETAFIEIWRNRESRLTEMPGFREFHLLQGESTEDCTLFATHTVWDSRNDFEAWTCSEQFRQAHAKAGISRDLYLGPPQFEGFESVL